MRILGMGTSELLFIGLICVLIFGSSKLPELGKAVGTTIKELKKSMREEPAEDKGPAKVK